MSPTLFRRAWIVGGKGLLGGYLCRFLKGEGQEVLLIDPGFDAAQAGSLRGCVQEPGVLEKALSFGAPDVVYFCAATHGGDAQAYRRAYLEPVRCVATLVPGAHMVFCSSAAVYEGRGEESEESPTPGSTEKLRVLLQAEQEVLRAGGVVARLVPLYGEQRCELLRRHLSREPQLPGPPERMLNYLHVEDAARALAALGRAPLLSHRVYNVCGESFTKAQVYALMEELTGVPASRETSPARGRGVSDHRIVAVRMRALWEPRVLFRDFVRHISCLKG